MGDSERELRLRLDQVLRQFGSVAEVARAVGVSDNAIYKWLSGRGQPSVANLVAVAKAGRVSLEWLATGREASPKRAASRPADRGDFVYVPRNTARDPSGSGAIRSDQVVDYIAFKAEWVRDRLGADPRNLLLVEALGDSMAPNVSEHDLLLVDLGEPRFRHDGLYLLRREHDLAVKRVQRRPDGSLLVQNDNPAYESTVVTMDEIRILGRVIWSAARI